MSKLLEAAYEESKIAWQIVDALRIAMYGSGGNFAEEVETLGRLLAKADDVPYMPHQNRLTQALTVIPVVTLRGLDYLNGAG